MTDQPPSSLGRSAAPAPLELLRERSPAVAGALVVFALLALVLLTSGRRDYPELHTILDTGMFLLSSVLALLLWDVSVRVGQPLARWLAITFVFTSLLELVHVTVTVEWTGPLDPIAYAVGFLRPATWPPPAYTLPLGVAGALWLFRRGARGALGFGLALAVVSGLLLLASYNLPRYSAPTWLGFTRPTLLPVPLLWAAVAWGCWRRRTQDRLLPVLALMAAVMCASHLSMLYSRAPHDTPAMVAHLGKVAAYLALLLSLMQLASRDMLDRIRAERALSLLNEELEGRVRARTSELASEVDVRRHAEQKAQAQVERLNLLHHITRAIGERQDLHSIFQVVVRSLEDQLPVDFACLCEYDALDGVLTVSAVGAKSDALALDLAMPERARIDIDENGLSRCVRGRLVYEPDIAAMDFPFPRRLAGGGLRSLVVAPLQVESQVFGVLVAARRQAQSFSSGECEFLRQLSEHVALAANQAQLHGVLQRAYDDLRQTQQTVMQQERLRALGQMASGIAHDINNALSPVGLYTESLLETERGLSPRARGYLETIQRAIEDVTHTVARMREFYRPRGPELELTVVQVNTLVPQVMELTRARWSDIPQQRGIVIDTRRELEADLPAIMGAESEIREALINLIFNAIDAMPQGGVLTVRTRATPLVEPAEGEPSSRQVLVEVVDTGVGMDEDTRRRCMEPFFTTKGERGTGLGLAMVYGVVQRHSCDIEIESKVGQGTTVRLSFESTPAVATAAAQPTRRSKPRVRLRILVVDDDPLLLKSLGDTLESDGHVVTPANGGQAGIDAFTAAVRRAEPFGVVITDLGMPHVDGRRVASTVKNLAPATPVILLTGWGQRLVSEGDVPPHVDRILSKPPKLRELREVLAQLA